VWGGGYGAHNKVSGDPLVVGSHDVSARNASFAAGLDYRVAPGTVLGFALAGGGTAWSLAQGLGGGGSDVFQAGAYGATSTGPLYLAGGRSPTRRTLCPLTAMRRSAAISPPSSMPRASVHASKAAIASARQSSH
jgi:uncharacterized protein with beta-barrel porin domain